MEGIDPVCVQVCPRGALSLKGAPGSVAEVMPKNREEKKRLLTLVNN
jgi:Fe-S-cluster-containing dehydrogenase component